jgi:hypothetical protein
MPLEAEAHVMMSKWRQPRRWPPAVRRPCALPSTKPAADAARFDLHERRRLGDGQPFARAAADGARHRRGAHNDALAFEGDDLNPLSFDRCPKSLSA